MGVSRTSGRSWVIKGSLVATKWECEGGGGSESSLNQQHTDGQGKLPSPDSRFSGQVRVLLASAINEEASQGG